MYTFSTGKKLVSYDPSACTFSVTVHGEEWRWCQFPFIQLKSGIRLFFSEALCSHGSFETGVAEGTRAEYRFQSDEIDEAIIAVTHMFIDKTDGRIHFDIRIENDCPLQIEEVRFPGAFSLSAEVGKGYTVFPIGQGSLIPAKDEKPIDGIGGGNLVYSRSAYMPFFGQMRNGTGYCSIYETPYDAKHYLHHIAAGDTTVSPIFIPSLGKMAYKREMIYDFFEDCTYVSIAKHYRKYVDEKGKLITLDEKAVKNPNVKRLYGAPTIRKTAKTHIAKGTKFYNEEDPSKNDSCLTFDEMGEEFKTLHRNGIRNAYLHLGGWCDRGYDNRHPDPFPVAEDAGGAEAMRRLAETCKTLGYMFGVHDQYRDYYYDAESFSFDNAIVEADGSHPYCDTWHGGPHTYLCARLAPDYVKRNYDTFEKLGIPIEGVYLDVFSVVELDECGNPDHRMTREECVQKRSECFELLNARGIVTSSEEVIDCIIPSLPMTDHALYLIVPPKDPENPGPFSTPKGIPIPLFNLVYHDCIITPWRSSTKPNVSSYGVPQGESFFLHGLLNGGTMFVEDYDDLEHLKEVQKALDLHRRVVTLEMTSHEFVEGDWHRQRTTFSDGTTVEVDLDNSTYSITYP